MDFKLRSNNKTRKGFSQFTQKTLLIFLVNKASRQPMKKRNFDYNSQASSLKTKETITLFGCLKIQKIENKAQSIKLSSLTTRSKNFFISTE